MRIKLNVGWNMFNVRLKGKWKCMKVALVDL